MAADNTGSSILSEKVQRALEVRTDTAAMKAALDALSHLPSESMDSRSVRVAIEQDALQQALLLQQELKGLVDVVSNLRQGVSETTAIAKQVSNVIHANVVTTGMPTIVDSPYGTGTAGVDPIGSTSVDKVGDGTKDDDNDNDDDFDKEQQLASLLAGAFRERDEASQRAETVAAFLDKFDLSEEDAGLLERYNFEDMEEDSNEGMAFLDALERVKAIRNELTTTFGASASVSDLLLGDDPTLRQQRLGATSAIRMMESLASKQERAFERLYHWLQKYLHLNSVQHVPTSSSAAPASAAAALGNDDGDILDEALSHPFVRRSLQVLFYVPAFYSHTLELIASSRRSQETRQFLLALTSGYHGRPPIEMKAHDPVNYVGDMLAFCFQSCSVEADVARGLVVADDTDGNGTGIANDAVGNNDEDDFGVTGTGGLSSSSSGFMTASDILAHAMSGLARPLKSRVLQVVSSLARRPDDDDGDDDDDAGLDDDEDAVARSRVSSLYSICGLLLFYRSALQKSVNKLKNKKSGGGAMTSIDDKTFTKEDNPLVTSIEECLDEASQAYVASLRVYGATLESLSLLTGDSEAVLVQSMVEQISSVRIASPGFAIDVDCPVTYKTPLSMEMVVETLLESAVSLCSSLDDAVTLKLSLTTAKRAGLSTTVASQLDGKISTAEQKLVQDLVETETKEVLDLCGLGTVVTLWRNMPRVAGITMATQRGLTPEDLDSAMKDFYTSLYSPPIPSFDDIKDPVLRKLARSKISQNVVAVYEELYQDITSPDKGGYDDLSFLGHTPQQVKTLFTA